MNNRVETIECQIKLMRDQLNALNGITVLAPAEPQRQHINQEVIEVEPVLVQQGTDLKKQPTKAALDFFFWNSGSYTFFKK